MTPNTPTEAEQTQASCYCGRTERHTKTERCYPPKAVTEVMVEQRWFTRARERIADTKRIAVGSDIHLLEMAVNAYDSLVAENERWKTDRKAGETIIELLQAQLTAAQERERKSVEQEREECAQIAENRRPGHGETEFAEGKERAAVDIMLAIRARAATAIEDAGHG